MLVFGGVIIDKGEQNFVSVQAVVKSLVSVHGTDEFEGSLLVFSDKSLYIYNIIFTYHLESRWLNSHWFIMAPEKNRHRTWEWRDVAPSTFTPVEVPNLGGCNQICRVFRL